MNLQLEANSVQDAVDDAAPVAAVNSGPHPAADAQPDDGNSAHAAPAAQPQVCCFPESLDCWFCIDNACQ